MTNKIDISSTALEKSIDLAKEFLEKLVSPPVEEVGLLLRNSVAYWRFKNQVRILNKAKTYCDRNKISPKAIPLKLLCPWMEGSALEEDKVLQDKWAILLSNMVDSEQNAQNHVFPYILGQISTDEFSFLERVFQEKTKRVRLLSAELENFRAERPSIEKSLSETVANLSAQIEEIQKSEQNRNSSKYSDLIKEKNDADFELRMLKRKENSISNRLLALEILPEGGLKDFELSNVIRLGLVKFVEKTSVSPQVVDIPNDPNQEYLSVDIDIDLEYDSRHVLTKLGELFIEACTEKKILQQDGCT